MTVCLKTGRFGPYVAAGRRREAQALQPAQGLVARRTWTWRRRLRLLRLPREVGPHPEDGQPILAGIGRYGPFVQHDGTYANLPAPTRCSRSASTAPSTLLAEKRAGGAAAAARPRR